MFQMQLPKWPLETPKVLLNVGHPSHPTYRNIRPSATWLPVPIPGQKCSIHIRLGKFDLTNWNSWTFPISLEVAGRWVFSIFAATQAPLAWYPLVVHPIPWIQRLPKTSACIKLDLPSTQDVSYK